MEPQLVESKDFTKCFYQKNKRENMKYFMFLSDLSYRFCNGSDLKDATKTQP